LAARPGVHVDCRRSHELSATTTRSCCKITSNSHSPRRRCWWSGQATGRHETRRDLPALLSCLRYFAARTTRDAHCSCPLGVGVGTVLVPVVRVNPAGLSSCLSGCFSFCSHPLLTTPVVGPVLPKLQAHTHRGIEARSGHSRTSSTSKLRSSTTTPSPEESPRTLFRLESWPRSKSRWTRTGLSLSEPQYRTNYHHDHSLPLFCF
jgi:hypothetical protein